MLLEANIFSFPTRQRDICRAKGEGACAACNRRKQRDSRHGSRQSHSRRSCPDQAAFHRTDRQKHCALMTGPHVSGRWRRSAARPGNSPCWRSISHLARQLRFIGTASRTSLFLSLLSRSSFDRNRRHIPGNKPYHLCAIDAKGLQTAPENGRSRAVHFILKGRSVWLLRCPTCG
jgi:hypothetical protein